MLDKLKNWWKTSTEDTRNIIRGTALIVGCGYFFYKAGVRDGQVKMMSTMLKYAGRM